ncbi:helix-turn-helix transcriptional regulator [Streptomyces sp. NPDC052020]|uniref:helix-turn-helix transcriptional regulator n=1 Tax=Streptomyces sp. NPDC052020 TaxID=3155677 RepID=UPI003426D0DD
MSDSEFRRRERAHFLRTRRESMKPEAVGLPKGPRRRTPGLRREEVAVLAGVSPTWYTYLEQARDISPSHEVLDSLADILGLSEDERLYLFNLSYPAPPPTAQSGQRSAVVENLSQIVESLAPLPAYLCSQAGDLMAWNHETIDWFGNFATPSVPRPNLLMWMFTSKCARERFVDWQEQARGLVACFRADALECRDTARVTSLVRDLTEASPHFRRYWDEHAVGSQGASQCKVRHPLHGAVTMRRIHLRHQAAPEPLKLVIHLPVGAPHAQHCRTPLTPPRIHRVSIP